MGRPAAQAVAGETLEPQAVVPSNESIAFVRSSAADFRLFERKSLKVHDGAPVRRHGLRTTESARESRRNSAR